MKPPTTEEKALGRVIYYARIQEAWGPAWVNRDKWPANEKAWRAIQHDPAAEIELIIVQARAALKWMNEQRLELSN